ncbi:MAG TPA: carboxypeptidase regulatory-like domain-containing protein, partial [Rhodanobacteraceae bacterium]|nr:carboxypeptidase regulatory-like domain-containing protein [Rhodanobacteraceae bacterium]
FAYQLDGSDNVVSPPGEFQCLAVSRTGDPVAGGWNFYSINTAGGLGDYPKFGVWPDGIYMSVNMFDYAASGSFQNVRLYAFNKEQMYAGAPSVQVVSFDAPAGEFTLLPANARLQTGTPPAGSPNYFAVVWQFLNVVSVYKFHVDWNSISTSTLTGPFTSLTATNWSQFTGANGDVPSPAAALDTLYPRLMVQNQYSNIGGVESLWDSHTVGASGTTSAQAAVRYYQVKVTGGSVEANATQAFTFSPDATVHRFMPSVEIDRTGNMAIGYSASSASLNPAMRYAGRLAGDAANSITQTETSLIEGTGSQNSTNRWGDYSSMSLDPDGCTFWMSNEYYAVTGGDWQTRIGAFKYPACTLVSSGSVQGTVTATIGGAPIAGATVSLGSRTTTTDAGGAYSFTAIASGTYPSLSAANPGYTTSTTTNIIVTDGNATTRNFSLAAAATSACAVDTTQADFQLGVPTNADLTASPGNVVLKENVSRDQHADDNGFNQGYNFSSTSLIGQTFTPSVSAKLTRVDAFIFCASCSGANPNMTLEVRTSSAGLPVMTAGGLLASSTIAGTSSGSGGTFSFTFAAPPTLTSGTQYGMVIRLVSNRTAGTQDWLATNGDAYAGGRRVVCTTSACANPTGPNSNSDLIFESFMDTGFAPSGDLISSTKDANPAAGNTPTWSTLSWNTTTPANTTLQFQAAGSNSNFGPFNFVGPDGTAATFYSTSGSSLSQFNGNRYLQYRAFLSTTDGTVTPTLNDATVCYADSAGASADLSITNTDGSATATPGGSVTYTITAANTGPSSAIASTVADTFPAALTCSWTCAGSSGGTCTASGSGNINDSVNLPSGGSVTYTASCNVSASATGSLVNTATVTAPVGVTDPSTGNNSATDTDTLAPSANLGITNTDGVTNATPGGSVTYTIIASNVGPSNAPGSTVADAFPAGLTCSWTCVGAGGGTCTASGSGNINNSVNLPSGGNVTYTASCTIGAGATGSL